MQLLKKKKKKRKKKQMRRKWMEVNLFSILSKPYLVKHFTRLICLKGIEIDSKDRTDPILNIDSVKVAGQKSPQLLLLHTGKYSTLFIFALFAPIFSGGI